MGTLNVAKELVLYCGISDGRNLTGTPGEEASRSLSKAKDLKDTLTPAGFACHDRTFVATKRFSRQNVCVHKTFCVQKTKQTNKQTKTLLRQERTLVATKDVYCRDKGKVVATKLCLPRQIFVATKVLLPEKYVCRNKSFFRNKPSFVATKVVFFVVFFVCLFVWSNPCRDERYTCGSSHQ